MPDTFIHQPVQRFVSEKISSEDLPIPLKVQPHPQPIKISAMHSPDRALSQADFSVDLPSGKAPADTTHKTTYDYELHTRPPTVIHMHDYGEGPSRNTGVSRGSSQKSKSTQSAVR